MRTYSVHTCMYRYVYVHSIICTHTHTPCKCTHKHKLKGAWHTYIYMCVHTHICMYIHTYTHMYRYTCTYIRNMPMYMPMYMIVWIYITLEWYTPALIPMSVFFITSTSQFNSSDLTILGRNYATWPYLEETIYKSTSPKFRISTMHEGTCTQAQVAPTPFVFARASQINDLWLMALTICCIHLSYAALCTLNKVWNEWHSHCGWEAGNVCWSYGLWCPRYFTGGISFS